ncbi:fumarate hydratase subunit beta [Gammaproteobacteria bacterium]
MLIRLKTPFQKQDIESLRSGDRVLISGVIYTARDAAHKRIVEAILSAKETPMEIEGQVIYFAGPSPARPGKPVGSIGPTTSYRMDPYSPLLIEKGLRGMIGKGNRTEAVKAAMNKFGCVYFGATGGAGATIAKSIRELEVIAYKDLGPEAVRRLVVVDFPAVVINDMHRGDLYESARLPVQET